jgi:hypothetical protein
MFTEASQAIRNGDVRRLRELALMRAPHPFDAEASIGGVEPFQDLAKRQAAIDLMTRLCKIEDLLRQHTDNVLATLYASMPTRLQLASTGRSLAHLFNSLHLLKLDDERSVSDELERLVFAVDRAFIASIVPDVACCDVGEPRTGVVLRLLDYVPRPASHESESMFREQGRIGVVGIQDHSLPRVDAVVATPEQEQTDRIDEDSTDAEVPIDDPAIEILKGVSQVRPDDKLTFAAKAACNHFGWDIRESKLDERLCLYIVTWLITHRGSEDRLKVDGQISDRQERRIRNLSRTRSEVIDMFEAHFPGALSGSDKDSQVRRLQERAWDAIEKALPVSL